VGRALRGLGPGREHWRRLRDRAHGTNLPRQPWFPPPGRGRKSAEQRDIYGGITGQQYDPCYHEACDTFSNNNNEVLDLNSDAIAFATLTYAMDTSSVNAGAAAA
jgi:hypothetical protein